MKFCQKEKRLPNSVVPKFSWLYQEDIEAIFQVAAAAQGKIERAIDEYIENDTNVNTEGISREARLAATSVYESFNKLNEEHSTVDSTKGELFWRIVNVYTKQERLNVTFTFDQFETTNVRFYTHRPGIMGSFSGLVSNEGVITLYNAIGWTPAPPSSINRFWSSGKKLNLFEKAVFYFKRVLRHLS